MFEFRFTSMKDERIIYYVYSIDKLMIRQFALQHGFELNSVQMRQLRQDEVEEIVKEGHFTLEKFYFKNNFSNDVNVVVTTRWFVEDAIRESIEALTDMLLLGSPIVRDDIELFKTIKNTINSLPYTAVMDYRYAEETIEDYDDSYYTSRVERYMSDKDPIDSDVIGDLLYARENAGDIEPITLDWYIRNFVRLCQDEVRG